MNIPYIDNKHDVSSKQSSKWQARSSTHYKLLRFLPLLCIGLGMLSPCFSANAQTVRSIGPFDVTFYNSGQGDEGGTGSLDWTGQEIEDITSCIATWASRITNTPGRQVKLHLFWNSLGGNILGETSSPDVGDGTTSWTDTERVWRTGVNLSASTSYDARMAFSTGVNWNIGPGTPSFSQYDYRSVITHEIGHTLGFDSTYNPTSDTFSSQGLSVWDKNLVDNAGNHPVAGGTGTPHNFNQVANPVFFTGSNAVANYGGNVPVYAPNPYQSGSSMSHLDQTLLPNALMRPAFGAGNSTRAPTALEWEIMKDLGWSVVGVKSWTKGAATLNWSDTPNWSPSGLPDPTWNVSFSTSGLTTGDTINLGGNQTINSLSIDSTASFTIGGSSGTLNLDSGYITRSTASSGTQTIARPLVVGSNTVWDIAGSGSLTIAGSLSAANSITKISTGMVVLAGSSNVPNNLIIDDGDLTLAPGGALTVANISGNSGALNFDGGTLNLTGTNNLHLFGIRVGKNGVGSFTLLPGKILTTDSFLTVGRDSGGQGTFTNQGGTVNASTKIVVGTNIGSSGHYIQQASPNPGDPLPSTTVVGSTYVGSFTGSTGGTGLIEMTSGTFNTSGIETGYGGIGTFSQSGGIVTVNGSVDLAFAGQGTYNLTGGSLILSSLTMGTGTPAFNFGGGTMQASASFASSVPLTLTGINGNATIDTLGNNVSLSGSVSGSGGLTKLGTGTLTFASINSADYLGATTISAGKLQLSALSTSTFNLHAITGNGALAVGSGASASTLAADSINVGTLSLGIGSRITINPIPGGPLASTANLTVVPEPSTAVLLLLAGLFGVFYCGYRRYCQ